MTIMGHYPPGFRELDEPETCFCQAFELERIEDWDDEVFTYLEERQVETETGIWTHGETECEFEPFEKEEA